GQENDGVRSTFAQPAWKEGVPAPHVKEEYSSRRIAKLQALQRRADHIDRVGKNPRSSPFIHFYSIHPLLRYREVQLHCLVPLPYASVFQNVDVRPFWQTDFRLQLGA